MDALIDSGASTNFLDTLIVEKWGISAIKDSRSFTLADGSTSLSTSLLDDVDVTSLDSQGTSNTSRNSFRIMKLNYDCILGMSWLQLVKPRIDWTQRTLTFESRSLPIGPLASLLDTIPAYCKKYESVFMESNCNQLPPSRAADLEIKLIDPAMKPKTQPIYQLSLKEQMALKEWIKENLSKGFIRNSKSQFAAPIFFVPKKDGTLRPCIDYRDLNSNTVLDLHPLPLISQLMDQISGSRIFTKLDLRGAYNLVRIKEGDEHKAAFRCKDGHFEPLVIQFGLTNAPACFQRFMHSIFRDHLDKFLIIYLDDILIYSKDLDSHRNQVELVLSLLEKNQLSVKASKCLFEVKRLPFLGYILSDKGISMDPQKCESIRNFPEPTNLKELRSFLGLANFYRSFIGNYSKKTKPLTDLTKKGKFLWNSQAAKALQDVKGCLVKNTMLTYPDQNAKFFMDTDASDHTIGAVLSQRDQDQSLKPVAFYSRKLSDAELNYSTYDKELLAIVDSLKYWRHYLISPVEPTQINTDHKNLLYFRTPQLLKPRHARWAEFLGQFPFKLVHIKGLGNTVADALSRANSSTTRTDTHEQRVILLKEDKWAEGTLMAIKTRSDWPNYIRSYLELDRWDPDLDDKDKKFLDNQLNKFYLEDQKLYFMDDKRKRLYVPAPEERTMLIKRYHEYLGHLASQSILPLVERHFFWPSMAQDFKDFISKCSKCQLSRNLTPNTRQAMERPITPIPSVALPFERWGLDFIQNLPETKKGNKHIITAIDYATRWVVAKAVQFMTQETVLEFLYALVMNYGVPLEIITDRGKSFLSDAVHEYEKLIGITHMASTPYHPQTNGMVERMHATLGQTITTLTSGKPLRWDEFLDQSIFALRVRTHSVTNFSPFYLLYGVEPRLPMDPRPPPSTLADLDTQEMDLVRNNITIRELEELGQHRAASYFKSLQQADRMNKSNTNLPQDHYFTEGDMVKLKHHGKNKFEFQWKGPYHIVRLGHPGTYHIMSPNGEVLPAPVNQQNLAPWLADTRDNIDFFYDGTTREISEPAPRHNFPESSRSSTPQVTNTNSSPQEYFGSVPLEGDSVTPHSQY